MRAAITILDRDLRGGSAWQPIVGETLTRFQLNQSQLIGEEQAHSVTESSIRILSKCLAPGKEGSLTGLVFGHVQSGKTLSFLSLICAARDNHIPLIILITGTSVHLQAQSERRLRRDLMIENGRVTEWLHMKNPSSSADVEAIRAALRAWVNPSLPQQMKRTVIITTMKQATHLRNLYGVLSSISAELTTRSALIIDDEGDQASLNANAYRPDKDATATYRSLLAIKDVLPSHSFIQYTATPQAPLLVSLLDVLSPSFVHILDPGPDYVGGQDFFCEGSRAVRNITSADLPRPKPPQEMPSSLQEAVEFFIAVIHERVTRGAPELRSMVVHPSREKVVHEQYTRWVRGYLKGLRDLLTAPAGDPERKELLNRFSKHLDILSLRCSLPASSINIGVLEHIINEALGSVLEVNTRAGGTPEPNWDRSIAHVLIGGQALDRGYTVEGLCVTYMPRSLGVGHADTLQQRARFFGYKRQYFCECFVYLPNDVVGAFEAYAQHEQNMRQQLRDLQESGATLRDWRRSFLLGAQLRPTRPGVLSHREKKFQWAGRWYAQLSTASGEAAKTNAALVERLRSEYEFVSWNKIGPNHLVTEVAYSEALDLINDWIAHSLSDGVNLTTLRTILEHHRNAGAERRCTIYLMAALEIRERSFRDGELPQLNRLFQGPREGNIGYVGDSQVFSQANTTIQIHRVRDLTTGGEPFVLLAVRLPAEMDETVVASPYEFYLESGR